MSETEHMKQHPSEPTHSAPKTQQPSGQQDAIANSPIDGMAASMIRTLEEIQCDPLLHHRLSQRGF